MALSINNFLMSLSPEHLVGIEKDGIDAAALTGSGSVKVR
jgi:hypothetical protein